MGDCGAPAARGMLELIGNTPLVQVTCFDTAGSELWVKLESHNPGGSIKDPHRAVDDQRRRGATVGFYPGGHPDRGHGRQQRAWGWRWSPRCAATS